jgi:predicted AAA+ superfamily ATPase
MKIHRSLKPPTRSFFLFGPRGTGKSTWLRDVFRDRPYFDLLNTSLQLELTREPGRLEARIGPLRRGSWVVIDEIQKIPPLLDEIHRLMETRGWKFALCGSSARKLRQGGVNLLGGRAVTRTMEGFSSEELRQRFDWRFSVDWGMLPWVQADRKNARDILSSYVNTYIKEEIKEEGIVRSLPPFLRFLGIAGLFNGQTVNGGGIARDAAVPRSTVDLYFSILEDTLLGHFLKPYRPHVKVREQAHPKFYWFDPGVARAAAGLLFDPPDSAWRGFALETMILHELRVYNHSSGANREISFYRTSTGFEIDFVIETRKRRVGSPPHLICIETKLSQKWDRRWERPIRSLKEHKGISVDEMIGVYGGGHAYHFDGFNVYPVEQFLERLHQGEFF